MQSPVGIDGLAAKLDKELDDFIGGLEKRSYTEGWPEDKWQEEMEKHPFFMTKAPDPTQELHPLMEGIQQLKYDPLENTAEELARTYKEEGLFNFKCKKYRFSIVNFTEALKQKCADDNLNAQLYNNRAAANFFLKNYRSCLSDCMAALKLQPDYEKPLFRAAQCCFQLARYNDCIVHCEELIKLDSRNQSVQKLRHDALLKKKMVERDQRKNAVHEKKTKLEEEKLLKAIQERNIKVLGSDKCLSSLKLLEPKVPEYVAKPVRLVQDRLVWPVLFLYPEYQTSDFVQEFHEDTVFNNQLAEVFAEPPNWDEERKYRLDNIRVYFEDQNSVAHLVDRELTLCQIISDKNYRVDAGTPSFIILAKGTKAEERFLRTSQ